MKKNILFIIEPLNNRKYYLLKIANCLELFGYNTSFLEISHEISIDKSLSFIENHDFIISFISTIVNKENILSKKLASNSKKLILLIDSFKDGYDFSNLHTLLDLKGQKKSIKNIISLFFSSCKIKNILNNFKEANIICSTSSEKHYFNYVLNYQNSYNYPYVYLTKKDFLKLEHAPIKKNKSKKIIGILGQMESFACPENLTDLLNSLPNNYELHFIEGTDIKYLSKTMQGISPKIKNIYLNILGKNAESNDKSTKSILESFSNLGEMISDNKFLTKINRIKFISLINLEQIMDYITRCDFIVIPDKINPEIKHSYSACLSAPIHNNIFISHTPLHREYEKYWPNKFTFFDVGNYAELEQKMLRSENKAKNTSIEKNKYYLDGVVDIIQNIISK